jgi:hypothetical protein
MKTKLILQITDEYDRHIARLVRWIQIVENLACEVNDCQQDEELYEDIQQIIDRLTRELGIRFMMIME